MGDTRNFDWRKQEGTTIKTTAPLTEMRENDELVTRTPHTGDRKNSILKLIRKLSSLKSALSQVAIGIVYAVIAE
jgi:hypothetical protein